MCRSRGVLAAAALAAAPVVSFAQTTVDPLFQPVSHGSGYALPTGIEFLGRSPNDYFVIEKDTGKVKRSNNGVISEALDLAVANDSERGLLGITKDPGFGVSNDYVYLYYSATSGADGGTWTQNQLTRYTWNGTNLVSPSTLAVFGTSGDGQANGPNHDAGPVVFGPDGKLYGITGDLNRTRAEQNNQGSSGLSASVGGVYRLNSDGSVPSDNPFTSHANTAFHRWYAYGIRNSFGINFDPLTNVLWQTENGPASYDEINRLDPGTNSGWSQIMGPDSRDPQGVGNLVNLAPGGAGTYSDPEFSWLSPVAVTGLSFLANSTMDFFYRDSLLVGDNNLGQLYRYPLNPSRDGFVLTGGLADLVADDATERNSVRFGQSFSAVTELTVGPDGGVYVVSIGTGNIWRLGGKSWKTDGNGDFTNAANWQGGAPGANDYVNFFDTISAPRTVNVNVGTGLRGVMFHSDHRYTLTPASVFSIGNSAGPAYLRVLKGSHTIDGSISVGANTSLDILSAASVMTVTGSMTGDNNTLSKTGPGVIEVRQLLHVVPGNGPTLSISGGQFRIISNGFNSGTSQFPQLSISGGQFDLTNNRAIIAMTPIGSWNGTNYTGLSGMVRSGRGSGNWNGSGIITSLPTADTALTGIAISSASQALNIGSSATAVWSGRTVTGSDTLLAYTYVGDADLNGDIDGDDYARIDAGFSGKFTDYANGDFDYSGLIDADDYWLIDRAYAVNGGDLVPAPPARVSAVPEPALATVALAALVFSRRRRWV